MVDVILHDPVTSAPPSPGRGEMLELKTFSPLDNADTCGYIFPAVFWLAFVPPLASHRGHAISSRDPVSKQNFSSFQPHSACGVYLVSRKAKTDQGAVE